MAVSLDVTSKVARRKSITIDDLDNFKEEINALIEEKLNAFLDEFVKAYNEATVESDSKCTCDECTCDSEPEQKNPARYIIFSGGREFFATDIKPNAMMVGIDFYLHETDPKTGKEYNSQGTITSADVVILDLEPEISIETFSSIKKNTIDYVIHQAQEAQARNEAMKAEQSKTAPDINHVSYS